MKKLKLFFCLTITILFFVKHSVAKLEYIPPSREIDVKEIGDYNFGIIEDDTTNIIRCYYATDTGINGYFDVNKSGWTKFNTVQHQKTERSFKDREVKVVLNEITHRGEAGYCEMRIRWATGEGPNRWTLTPYNNPINGEGKNLSDITYKINFFYTAPLLQERIAIYEHASFMNYLNMGSHYTLKLCTLKFDNITIELNLHSAKASSSLTSNSLHNEEILDRVSSLGQGLCGFKYINATTVLNGPKWTLTATDDEGKLHEGIFTTTVLPKISEEVLHTRRELGVGDSYTINCGDKYNDDFCHLFNPAGESVQTDHCQYISGTFKMDDIGVWKCYTGNKYSTETIEYTIELVKKDDANKVLTWVNETEDYVNIGCQLADYYSQGMSYCKMVTPKHQMLLLQPISATDRYLAIGTDYKKGRCSMQLKKPVQEFEKGTWHCEIGGGDVTGGFLEVNKTEIPYSSVYCSIHAPNGTEYLAGSESELQLGRCSLTVHKTNYSDSGTWICSFAQRTGVPDDKIIVEVTIAENLVHNNWVQANAGSSAKLMCSSNGLPLKYCRFIDPSGKAYHIHNHENSTSISYYGRGLEYGDCGIRITNTQTTDEGSWTCVTQIFGDTQHGKRSAKILLIVA